MTFFKAKPFDKSFSKSVVIILGQFNFIDLDFYIDIIKCNQ